MKHKNLLLIIAIVAYIILDISVASAWDEDLWFKQQRQRDLVSKPFTIPDWKQSLIHEPLIHEPLIHEPLIHEPLIHEPLIHEPLIHEPLIREPLIHEPLIHEPLIHEPLVAESFTTPAWKQPRFNPINDWAKNELESMAVDEILSHTGIIGEVVNKSLYVNDVWNSLDNYIHTNDPLDGWKLFSTLAAGPLSKAGVGPQTRLGIEIVEQYWDYTMESFDKADNILRKAFSENSLEIYKSTGDLRALQNAIKFAALQPTFKDIRDIRALRRKQPFEPRTSIYEPVARAKEWLEWKLDPDNYCIDEITFTKNVPGLGLITTSISKDYGSPYTRIISADIGNFSYKETHTALVPYGYDFRHDETKKSWRRESITIIETHSINSFQEQRNVRYNTEPFKTPAFTTPAWKEPLFTRPQHQDFMQNNRPFTRQEIINNTLDTIEQFGVEKWKNTTPTFRTPTFRTPTFRTPDFTTPKFDNYKYK